MLPSNLFIKLADQNCLRESTEDTRAILESLPVSPDSDFVNFFACFNGPVGSDHLGYQILDLVEDNPSVITATKEMREQCKLPQHCFVLSDFLAGGMLVYNSDNDSVYDVDVEGGVDLLITQQLQPRWSAFSEFISDFFE